MTSLLTVFTGGQALSSGHAGVYRGLRDGGRNQFDYFPIEHAGNYVIRVQLFPRDDLRYGVGGGQFHLLVDLSRSAVERPAEDAGEGQHVDDLIRIVGTPRGHHAHIRRGLFGHDLRRRVCQRENDRIGGHLFEVRGCDRARSREADEDVRAANNVVDRTALVIRVGVLGVPVLHEIHAVLAAAIDRPLAVAADDLADAGAHENLRAGHARRAYPAEDYLQIFRLLVDDPERVDQRGENHDCRSVLIVMKDRDLHFPLQTVLDLEAARGRDVFQVDAAEAGRDRLDRPHDLIRVGRVQTDGPRIDVGEFLEEHCLAFHHRHRCLRADVAQSQYSRPVGYDGDGVLLDRQRVDLFGVVVDRHADARHAGRVGHRKIGSRFQWRLVLGFDLAAEVQQKCEVRDVDDLDSGQSPDVIDDLLAVLDRSGVDRDVAYDMGSGGLDDVDRADVAAGATDRRDDLADHPHLVVNAHAHRDAVRRARRPSHFSASLPLARVVLILHNDRLPLRKSVRSSAFRLRLWMVRPDRLKAELQ